MCVCVHPGMWRSAKGIVERNGGWTETRILSRPGRMNVERYFFERKINKNTYDEKSNTESIMAGHGWTTNQIVVVLPSLLYTGIEERHRHRHRHFRVLNMKIILYYRRTQSIPLRFISRTTCAATQFSGALCHVRRPPLTILFFYFTLS